MKKIYKKLRAAMNYLHFIRYFDLKIKNSNRNEFYFEIFIKNFIY